MLTPFNFVLAHQKLSIFSSVLLLHTALRLVDLLLEDEDHLLDVTRGDQLHGQGERLSPHLQVRRAEHPQYVHHQFSQNLLICWRVLHGNQAVKHYQLHIVVTLLDNELNVSGGSCLDSSGGVGEGDQGAGGLVPHAGRVGIEKVVDASDEPAALTWVLMTHPIYKLHYHKLKDVSESVNLVDASGKVGEGSLLIGVDQHHEGVPLAAHVLLSVQEVRYQLRGVRDEEIKVLVDGEDGEDRVPADIGVPVLQTGADGGHQGLQQLGLLQLAEESQGGPADELVGVLQVFPASNE